MFELRGHDQIRHAIVIDVSGRRADGVSPDFNQPVREHHLAAGGAAHCPRDTRPSADAHNDREKGRATGAWHRLQYTASLRSSRTIPANGAEAEPRESFRPVREGVRVRSALLWLAGSEPADFGGVREATSGAPSKDGRTPDTIAAESRNDDRPEVSGR